MSQKYLSFYRERIPNFASPNEKGESVNVCVFHSDKSPSLAVNVETGLWKCYTPTCAGHRGGSWKQFEKLLKGEVPGASVKVEPIDSTSIDGFHELLLKSKDQLDLLRTKRGLALPSIRKHRLGWDGDRILIPILGPDGTSIVNVRKYKYGATEDKMIAWAPRYNRARLYPIQNLAHETVVLCEGELDALLLEQAGVLGAITSTGGADTWFPEFTDALRGKHVIICYDADVSGKKAAKRIAVKLLESAASVKVLTLPLAGTKEEKDITDYFITLKHTVADFKALMDTAEPVVSISKTTVAPDEKVHKIHLSRIGDKQYVHKRVATTVLVAGKDLAPYQVPWKVTQTCQAVGSKKECDGCKLGQAGGQVAHEFQEHSPELLEFVNVPKEKIVDLIKRLGGIPARCNQPKLDVVEYVNIETVKFIPELDFNASGAEYVIRNMFYLGQKMETNRTYHVEGVVMPEPKTQYATALIYHAEKAQSSVDKFELTLGIRELLEKFKVSYE